MGKEVFLGRDVPISWVTLENPTCLREWIVFMQIPAGIKSFFLVKAFFNYIALLSLVLHEKFVQSLLIIIIFMSTKWIQLMLDRIIILAYVSSVRFAFGVGIT